MKAAIPGEGHGWFLFIAFHYSNHSNYVRCEIMNSRIVFVSYAREDREAARRLYKGRKTTCNSLPK